jgi:tRNA nucleotidyltransferase (CCA-adding enzyme)
MGIKIHSISMVGSPIELAIEGAIMVSSFDAAFTGRVEQTLSIIFGKYIPNKEEFLAAGKKLTSLLMTKHPEIGLRFLERCGCLKLLIPELSKCVPISQDARFHIDTVFEHCIKVCSSVDEDVVLRWAGLLHDIGKLQTCDRKENGTVSFHKHELFSTTLAQKVFGRLQIDKNISIPATFLISQHMYHYSHEWTDKTVARFIRRINIQDTSNLSNIPLFRLRMADRASRGLEPITNKQRDFEIRIKRILSDESVLV